MDVRAVIKAQMGQTLPFVRHNGIKITEVGDGLGEAVFPQTENSLNHVNSQHAGGLFTVGEAASGAAMSGLFADQILNIRPLAAGASIRYTKIAKGDITARAKVDGDAAALRDSLASDGRVSFSVEVELTDVDGNTVAHMTVDWSVKKV